MSVDLNLTIKNIINEDEKKFYFVYGDEDISDRLFRLLIANVGDDIQFIPESLLKGETDTFPFHNIKTAKYLVATEISFYDNIDTCFLKGRSGGDEIFDHVSHEILNIKRQKIIIFCDNDPSNYLKIRDIGFRSRCNVIEDGKIRNLSFSQQGKRWEEPQKPKLQYILDDVIWFARTPSSEAKSPTETDLYIPYPMNKTVDINNQCIIIRYQVDRDSELSYVSRKYKASSPVYCEKEFIDEEEAKEYTNNLKEFIIAKSDKGVVVKYLEKYQFTAGEILEHIYRFYSNIMTNEHKKAVQHLDDFYGYSKIAKKSLAEGTTIYMEEIMGDCMNFEGLKFYAHNKAGIPIYEIEFGS